MIIHSISRLPEVTGTKFRNAIGGCVIAILLLGGCSSNPPSLFEVETFCEGEVQQYKIRMVDIYQDIRCKE